MWVGMDMDMARLRCDNWKTKLKVIMWHYNYQKDSPTCHIKFHEVYNL